MTKLSKAQLAAGCRQFLMRHAQICQEIENLTESDAALYGLTLENHRQIETMREISRAARERNVDANAYLANLVVESSRRVALGSVRVTTA